MLSGTVKRILRRAGLGRTRHHRQAAIIEIEVFPRRSIRRIGLGQKLSIFGMIQRGGEVVIRMLENVKQPSIFPLIRSAIALEIQVYTNEYDIHNHVPVWGYEHKPVCHSCGEYARDEDVDKFDEVHVNTVEELCCLLRSWLRPHRGISKESLPDYLGFFEFVHNARQRGKRLLDSLLRLFFTEQPGVH
jgi:transposase